MLQQRLERSNSLVLSLYAMAVAFGAYFCMYAFRKPFSVGTFAGEAPVLGIAFKSCLVISQVLGYALSKFIGIKIISELKRRHRARLFIGLILIAESALLVFSRTPAPWNILLLFFNGLPLGMIWGIVFSYLEGRRTSEILGAGLSASFIVASGAVKSIGKWLVLHTGISEFQMPAATGALFLLPLLVFVYLLEQIPPPTQEDIHQRAERLPMTGAQRRRLFVQLAPGLILLGAFYTLLTAYRDFRDNFAVELWSALGYGNKPAVFTLSEIPIAILVLVTLGVTMFIKDNKQALWVNFTLVLCGALLVGGTTQALDNGWLSGAVWMVLVGLGLYIAYVPFNCIIFDRMVAVFRYKGNAGFLIYFADAFGYLGSVVVLLWKDFGEPELSWLEFFKNTGYGLALGGVVLMLGAMVFFRMKTKAV